MTSILFAWALMLAVCIPLGGAFHQIFFKKQQVSFIDAFWLGWGALLFILMIWHLFFPVNWITILVVVLIGTLSFNNSCKKLNYASVKSWKLLLALMAVVWMANRAVGGSLPYDAGLYHLQSIKWTSTHQIIPGLGNLHGRLAFNSSYFLYLAAIKSFFVNFYKIGSGLLLIMAITQSIFSGMNILRDVKQKCFRFHDVVAFLFLWPLMVQAFRFASTTSPDLPIFILGFIISVKLSEMIFETLSSAHLLQNIIFIIFLATVGVTIKLSFLVFGLVFVFVALVKCRMLYRDVLFLKKLFLCFLLSTGMIIILLFRGIILSGYPLYPSILGGMKTVWQVPMEKAISEADWVKSWARLPHKEPIEVLGNWQWFNPWLKRMMSGQNLYDFLLPFVLIILALFLLVVFRKKINHVEIRKLTLLILPASLSTFYWFIFAPEPRFAGAAFFCVGISLISFLLFLFSFHVQKRAIILMSLCGLFCTVLIFFGFKSKLVIHERDINLMPAPFLQQKITDSGLKVITTKDREDQCWDAPLPCTPYFNRRLRLIDKDNIRKGFYVK